jgi:hypothetical protein
MDKYIYYVWFSIIFVVFLMSHVTHLDVNQRLTWDWLTEEIPE